jgi:hypothetical protein
MMILHLSMLSSNKKLLIDFSIMPVSGFEEHGDVTITIVRSLLTSSDILDEDSELIFLKSELLPRTKTLAPMR